jgi:hypothetical protein
MENDTASIPIAAKELLMRRVPAGKTFFLPDRPRESPMGPTWLAFKPTEQDTAGISLSRMWSEEHSDFLTIESFAARACSGKPTEKHFYVAVLSAGQLMATPLHLELKPDPIDGDPGHIIVPQLHTNLDKQTRRSLALTIAREYCRRLVGPFNGDGPVAASFIDWKRDAGA